MALRNLDITALAYLPDRSTDSLTDLAAQNLFPIFGYPNYMVLAIIRRITRFWMILHPTKILNWSLRLKATDFPPEWYIKFPENLLKILRLMMWMCISLLGTNALLKIHKKIPWKAISFDRAGIVTWHRMFLGQTRPLWKYPHFMIKSNTKNPIKIQIHSLRVSLMRLGVNPISSLICLEWQLINKS